MEQKLFDVTVTFTDRGSATVSGLTQEQMWALQDVCRLIETHPPEYSTNGVLLYSVGAELVDKRMARNYKASFFDRLSHRFNRAMFWLQPLLLMALLSSHIFAQDKKPRLVEPIRVSVRTPQNEINIEMANAVRVELGKPGNVAIGHRHADYEIQMNSAPLVGSCEGYVVAVVVINHSKDKASLQAYSGATIKEIAAYIFETFNRDELTPRHALAKGGQ